MKERLIKSWVTSLFGVLVGLFGFLLMYQEKIEWYVFLVFVLAGMWLLRAKHSEIKDLKDKILNKKL